MKKIVLALGVAGSGLSVLAFATIFVAATFIFAAAEFIFGCFSSIPGLWALISLADETTRPTERLGAVQAREKFRRYLW